MSATIKEVDVWAEGTDEELAQVIATSKGQPLPGHAELVCVDACIETAPPIVGHYPPPRRVPQMDAHGKVLLDAEGKEKPNLGIPPIQDQPTVTEGKRRARLNYKATS